MARLAVLALLLSTGVALKLANNTNASVAPSATPATQKDVDAARAQLDKMEVMLTGVMKSLPDSRSKVIPAIKLFTDNLHQVLEETKAMKPAPALKKMRDAKAGVAHLVAEMTQQQEHLMKEDFESRESLLMGVLMTNKAEPMEKQLAILKDEDFAGLDVSKELLHTHDNKTALYVQAAKYLDTHKNAGGALSKGKGASRLADMAASFDRRVTALEKEAESRDSFHKKRIAELNANIKKGGKDAKMWKSTMKREDRRYKKMAAMSKHDVETMKEAAKAVRSGDPNALKRAQAALQKSLDSLKNKNSGMVVFLQQGNAILGRDCPYCAAQCVEKCHAKGEPYVSCLTECADAGK